MSKKGAFIYQQIELTTAEWASNTTVYPASVWLFERLDNGKFNMKLADGAHTFADLPAVLQDMQVSVKTNNETTYILQITTAAVLGRQIRETPQISHTDRASCRGKDKPQLSRKVILLFFHCEIFLLTPKFLYS